MNIVDAEFKIEKLSNGKRVLKMIEKAARVCYKSEGNITENSYHEFIARLLSRDPTHLSIIEHESMRVRFISNRGFTHELVRHRLASFSQESTRYCNYSKGKFGSVITVIKPIYRKEGTEQYRVWKDAIEHIEKSYMKLLQLGERPEQARDILPIGLKTEIIMTTNLRQWGHVFYLRTDKAAHPQMRQLMNPLLAEVRYRIPVLFDNLSIYR